LIFSASFLFFNNLQYLLKKKKKKKKKEGVAEGGREGEEKTKKEGVEDGCSCLILICSLFKPYLDSDKGLLTKQNKKNEEIISFPVFGSVLLPFSKENKIPARSGLIKRTQIKWLRQAREAK